MGGNVHERTRTTYRPYRSDPAADRDATAPAGEKVVRGGAWCDRPRTAGSAHRWKDPAWRRVHNGGFRVIGVVTP